MSEYELVHWGVKGMKWGVRRYQNKDGSLTPAGKKRARAYRDKEIKALDKTWRTDKLEKRLDKNVKRYSENPNDRLRDKIGRDAADIAYRKGLKAVETSAVRNMSLKDLTSEMQEVGARKVNNVMSVIGGATMAGLVGVGVVSTTKISSYKSNRRISPYEFDRTAKSARLESKQVTDSLRKRQYE